ncbi:tetratricopeptide repeat-containing sensor histidine kinase [Pleionea sediminis]|uniref:tetratricopeptide repeat-containing sensor histidine kinase n=1 Tax=Pleionea sediminis TaxID=2569479 RepID=UPI0013DDC4D8|nr:tetratricopeptide repeat-containing sensor histidine kinase [Pleionea sediminis]
MNRQQLALYLIVILAFISAHADDVDLLHAQIFETADRAAELIYQDPKQASMVADQAINDLKSSPNIELYYRLNLIKSDAFVEQNLLEQSLQTLQNLLTQVQSNDLPMYKAQVLSRMGEVFWYQGKIYEAIDHLERSLNLYQAAGYKKEISSGLNNIGIMYRHLGDYDKALNYLLKSLSYKESLGDKSAMASTLNNIGVLYYFLQKYDQAIEQYNKSIELYQEVNEHDNLADPFNNKGQALEKLGQLTDAIELYQKSLVIEQDSHNKRGQGYSHSNIGAVLRKLGRLEEAQIQLERALTLARESKVPSVETEALLQLGLLHADLGESNRAIESLQQGLSIARDTTEKEKIKTFHFQLSKLFETKGLYKEALQHYRDYKVIADQLSNSDRKDRITRLEFKNKLDKREQEIQLLKQENEIKSLQVKNSKFEKQMTLGLSALSFVVFALMIGIIYHRKKLNREREISDQLAQLDDLKSQFFSQTSAELLTPIQQIHHLSDEMLQSLNQSSSEFKKMRTIDNQSSKLNLLIRNLLDFSADRGKSLSLNLKPVNFYDITHQVVELCLDSQNDLSISFVNQVTKEIPKVKADAERIKQVFFNVCSTVFGHITSGNIYLHAIPLDNRLIIRVSSQDLSERTNQLHFESIDVNELNSFQMKLSLRLIELHEGELWIENQPPEFTVCFTLPIY